MINSKAFDVECFKNAFSVTIVDVRSYLKTFADCVDENKKAIALPEKLSVKEIKERLDRVDCESYIITDTDDSQLLQMIAAFNQMEAHYIEKIDETGKVMQEPVRYDLFGYNILGYDDIMIKAFLMKWNMCSNTKELIHFLYDISQRIISAQKSNDPFYRDQEIELIKTYRLPYQSVDLYKLFALNAATVNIDKDTGERQKFGKGLKQTSINLKWHELLEFTLPPVDDEEYETYWKKEDQYRGTSAAYINSLAIEDFNRPLMPKYVPNMLHYNKNDVFICCEIIRQCMDEIQLRYSLSTAFKLRLLSSSRANIADALLLKFYSEYSGLHKSKYENLRTERTAMAFKKVIFPHIEFKTKQLQDFLEEIKKVTIYHVSKKDFERTINFYGTEYTIATGGIHTKDKPAIYVSDDKYLYMHHDYTSYYPSIVISFHVCPKHIIDAIFNKMVSFFKDTRVKCKHTPDSEQIIIDGVPNKLSAEALKIVINAIYGKFGSDKHWLYDRLAQLQVTINGQLMTMTLVEELELNGIHCISANTDGIILKLPRDKFDVYKEITDRWNEKNKMGADYEIYDMLVTRDINNYFDIQTTKKGIVTEFKGDFDPKMYIKNLQKGYDMPIVAKAVYEYFAHNVPIMETLHNHKDILDFCKTQNIGRKFDVCYKIVENNEIKTVYSQRYVRYYVAQDGIKLLKKDKFDGKESKLASGRKVRILNSLDDKSIEQRNIDYAYYYEECYKIIDPIKLGISPNAKADASKGIRSGKYNLKHYSRQYNTLFDDLDD